MSDKTVKAEDAQNAAPIEGQTNAKDANVKEEKVVDTSTPAEPKVKKRGIASARGTQRLKFSNEIAASNGLFLGHLASVEVSTINISEDKTGMPSFNGLDVPRLVLTFTTNEDDVNKRHYVPLSFTAVESNVETIPGGKGEWKVNQVFDWLKAVLNVFVLKGREMTEEEEDAMSLSYIDTDDEGQYSAVDPEDVVAAWKVLFENFENIMNRSREGQPAYKAKDGKIIPLWIKLLRFTKNGNKGWQPVNRGDLSFPTFVGEGCIEIFKQNTLPSIRIDAVKESIAIMNIESAKAKAPNLANGMPHMGGTPVDTMGNFSGPASGFGNIDTSASEDMPF